MLIYASQKRLEMFRETQLRHELNLRDIKSACGVLQPGGDILCSFTCIRRENKVFCDVQRNFCFLAETKLRLSYKGIILVQIVS